MENESVEELGLIVGSNIRYFRMRKNLRQADLAVLAGVTKTTVSNIECGQSWPEYESLKAIMNTLGMLPSDLTSQIFREATKELAVAEDEIASLTKENKAEETLSGIGGKHH
ncbi:helix-turn-helix domain-containing protein [Treponema sp.]|uniref:helix-turn-helix domain-containing protein n=1 Tax=Treponema sp. TaxID=166 RepID=UPI00388DF3A5